MEMKFLMLSMLIWKSVHSEKYKVNGLECDKCPPGTHWVADCKNGQKTECKACPTGTYSETYNIAKECEDCTRDGNCPTGQVFKNTCSRTTNNHCECPDGEYWHIIPGHDGQCYLHTKCSEDQVVVEKGTPTEDTRCGPKPTDGKTPTPNAKDEKKPNSKRHPGAGDEVTTTQRPMNDGDAKGGSHKYTDGEIAVIIIVCLVVLVLIVFGIVKIRNWVPNNQPKETKNKKQKRKPTQANYSKVKKRSKPAT